MRVSVPTLRAAVDASGIKGLGTGVKLRYTCTMAAPIRPTGKPMTIETLVRAGTAPAQAADGQPRACEDVLLVSGHLYGVFDGGLTAATAASEVFGDKSSASLEELCEVAQKQVNEAIGVRSAKGLPTSGLGLAVVQLERSGIQWVYSGRSEIIAILPDGSFEHLSAEKSNESFVHSGKRKITGIRHLLIATDGLFNQQATPEISAIVFRFLDGGLSAVYAPLEAAEQREDAAAIAISFLPPNPSRTQKAKPTKKGKSAKKLGRAVGVRR